MDIATQKFQLSKVREHVLSPEKVVDHLVSNFEACIVGIGFDHFRESNIKVPRHVIIEEFVEKPAIPPLPLCAFMRMIASCFPTEVDRIHRKV